MDSDSLMAAILNFIDWNDLKDPKMANNCEKRRNIVEIVELQKVNKL
jgi:hypothetical protein